MTGELSLVSLVVGSMPYLAGLRPILLDNMSVLIGISNGLRHILTDFVVAVKWRISTAIRSYGILICFCVARG